MQEVLKIIIGIAILIIGIPVGNILAKSTREELRIGRKWFTILISICIIGAVFSLIFGNDAFLFSFLFIAIVTSRSLVRRR
jgi:phosphoglycerol transferase MdoB-like AlkP superfamily enzyme